MQSLIAERDPVNVILPLGICSSTLDLKHSLPHQLAQPFVVPSQGQGSLLTDLLKICLLDTTRWQ